MNRLIFLLVLIQWWCIACRSGSENDSPNVLMICIDDLNTFLGCLDYDAALTPNIDRLASRGVLFTNAHCQAPLCGPSRASILTGLRPTSTGIYGQINDDHLRSALKEPVLFLPEYFKQHGYHTMGVGKIFHQHAPEGVFDESGGREPGFGPKPPDGGFFKWKKKGTSTDWGAFPAHDSLMPDYRSTQWTIDRLGREYNNPFLLTVGFLRPHVPWYVPQQWMDRYDTADISTPPWLADDFDDIPDIVDSIDYLPMFPSTSWAIENGEWKNIVQAYLACISFVDHYVGEILKALENGPHAKNTIVILWSDHGYRLGEKGTFAKHCLWDVATRVPVIVQGPEIPQNKKVDAPVELLSIYPTLLELSGLPPNDRNEGVSLVPLISEDNPEWNYPAITTYGRGNHAVVHGNYRYIRYEDGSEELYDHRYDVNEWHNLVSDDMSPANREVMDEMKNMMPDREESWSSGAGFSVNEYFKHASGD